MKTLLLGVLASVTASLLVLFAPAAYRWVFDSGPVLEVATAEEVYGGVRIARIMAANNSGYGFDSVRAMLPPDTLSSRGARIIDGPGKVLIAPDGWVFPLGRGARFEGVVVLLGSQRLPAAVDIFSGIYSTVDAAGFVTRSPIRVVPATEMASRRTSTWIKLGASAIGVMFVSIVAIAFRLRRQTKARPHTGETERSGKQPQESE